MGKPDQSHEHKVDVHRADERMGPPKSQLPVHLLMIASQMVAGIYYVVTRVALVNGMNRIVLSFYRDVLAMVCLVPAAYFIDKGNRVKLSWGVVFQLFLLGLTGIYGSNYLLFVGIEYTSAEVSAAVQPAIPVLTALVAIVFGVDVVYWRRRDGRAKVAGIVASCSGAIVMTFYKGPEILRVSEHMGLGWTALVTSLKEMSFVDIGMVKLTGWTITGWQFGVLCLFGNCVCMAAFINLQAPLLRKYPAPVSVIAYSYFFGAVFMGITGYFTVTDPADWALSWGVNLAAVIYNGVVASAVNFGIMAWCLTRVGPLFFVSFIPLQPVLAAIIALIFLDTTIFFGSILGTVLVFTGLFLVSWSREETGRLAFVSRHIEGRGPPLYRSEADALQEPLVHTSG